MLVTKNMCNKEMYNMQQYNIDKIQENDQGDLEFILNGQTFSHSEFRESFIPAFCVTVYKYQGSTITEPYNIYDADKMDKKTTLHGIIDNNKSRSYPFNKGERNV